MRRISALYNWYASRLGVDFEQMVAAGSRPQIQHIRRALHDFRNKSLGSSARKVASQLSPPVINDCIATWRAFIGFAVLSDNWRSGKHPLEDETARTKRRDFLRELSFNLEQLRVPEAPSNSHEPFSPEELLALESGLIEGGSKIFSPATRQRNVMMYRVIRASGIRISELLKLKHDHLPAAETRSQRLLRELSQSPLAIAILRQPDDPSDPRLMEPNVKRGDRSVELPDLLMREFTGFAHSVRVQSHEFIFRRHDHDISPLSLSGAEGIAAQIQHAIGRDYPNLNNFKFNWHRLRATRAVEAVQEFFPDGTRTEGRVQAFLAYFGWASLDSAEPYLKSLVNDRKAASFARQQQRRKEAKP
jgi:hypothetical protein